MSDLSWRGQPGQLLLIGLGIATVGGAIALGACFIPGSAGYAGVGPNFLPWLVAVVLMLCGGLLAWQVRHGGWRDVEAPSGAARGDWRAFAWVGAAVLANAALITTLGFVLSCALCFAMAVRGLRQSEGRPAGSWRQALVDLGTGLAISAPVFWLFRGLLAIHLPALLPQGWL
ncbi:tripartite tricarboxylate transporter TctB family protein [Piscinibacter sp. HJYY11]|uniref:tripartite tricarboxylate transporter TctB family protein n=1 Tax=Piscinibacter sp. HJYY11 TaxID=2801333 RepID=UPI00191F8215|nr:tripartite tricarboxylate transporter TctB family protein [Piscinibacter sp. HJYY11]MBL0730579.1 tripartite tricarboxylate transporter TctB family protein [Piscinibacter sp. HJYY11]